MAEQQIFASKKEKRLAKKTKSSSGGSGSWNNFLTMLQELGKALQFPIAVLPFAAILNRFGALGLQYTSEILDNGSVLITNKVGYWISTLIQKPGAVPFENLPLLFAIGTAFGLAKDHRGEVALVALIFYMSLAALTAEHTLPEMFYKGVFTFEDNKGDMWSRLFYVPLYKEGTEASVENISGGKYILDIGVLGGIVSGCMSAFFYNKFKDIKLPTALSFFGGRRFVPMVALVAAIPVALLFSIIWPWIQYGLVSFGGLVANPNNPIVAVPGTAIYGVLNRLLLPFGLHQILNTFFWFQLPVGDFKVGPINGNVIGDPTFVNGDINAFANGMSNSGLFQSGFFPIMMGGMPCAALAMIMSSRKENRKEVAGFLGGVAAVSFLSGITEPLEFSFVFISPLLLLLHALMTGVFVAITTGMHIQIGFGFSAGFIDYLISFAQSWGIAKYHDSLVLSNPLWILVLSVGAGLAYYLVFYITITKMNLATPGREIKDDASINSNDLLDKELSNNSNITNKYDLMAAKIIKAVGEDNFVSIDNCATRLRLILKDNSLIDDKMVKLAGAFGTKRLGAEGAQIVIGPDVEHVANSIKKQLGIEWTHKFDS
ncbi:PTS transporter subunit EIIC [Spiroplasma apis]|uniref:PTS system N-acetylglucosamine-specific IIC component n=1 Tax=Spiroplasma apis B31 TaxID=1276258 RepID=V5RJV2_SPIAP|nr:PTS transporter subunit EIIC [Spiroplasma apis]AHB36055.1 PTS system N-acetylglucosamine-specific IIC component [Spiroplasma apis B31]